jgi:hypothetical protein
LSAEVAPQFATFDEPRQKRVMSEEDPEQGASRMSEGEMISYAQAHPPLEQGITVRLLSPLGVYPTEGFRHLEAAVVLSQDVCA